MPRANAQSYRLPTETVAQIDSIRWKQGGLSKTAVMVLAVEYLYNALCRPSKPETKKSARTN